MSVNGRFYLVAEFECPHCQEEFNAFDIDELLDDGFLYKHLMDREHWSDQEPIHKEIDCPSCKERVLLGTAFY